MNELHHCSAVVLTGASGSGTSHLIGRLKEAFRAELLIVDRLAERAVEFAAPDEQTKMVVLDHAAFGETAAEYCNSPLNWGKAKGVPVLLVAFKIDELQGLGVQLDEPIVAIELRGGVSDKRVVLRYGSKRQELAGEQFYAAVAAFETAAVMQRAARK